jgi:hypothetical protein
VISTPISYGSDSTAIVTEFEDGPTKVASRWSDADVESVRREIKQHYIVEQEYLCCYCGIADPSTHGLDWDVEHIVARRRRPEFMFTPANLAVACRECNVHKGSKETLVDPACMVYPTTGDAFLVVHPHFDDWSEHILRDHLTYASFTVKGSWTIKECNLNRFAGRLVGIRFPISDTRYEQEVRKLLAGGMTLQEAVDELAKTPKASAP